MGVLWVILSLRRILPSMPRRAPRLEVTHATLRGSRETVNEAVLLCRHNSHESVTVIAARTDHPASAAPSDLHDVGNVAEDTDVERRPTRNKARKLRASVFVCEHIASCSFARGAAAALPRAELS